MKKTILTVLLPLMLVTTCFIIYSCSKESKKTEAKSEILKKSQPSASIKYSCVGQCNGTNEECGMEFDLTTNKVKCTCEGCAMSFEIENPSDHSTATRANFVEIAQGMNNHILATHQTTNYLITSIVQTFYDLSEVFEIIYTVDSVYYSVMVVYEFDSTDALTPKKKILIDCSGSCANSPGNCVEEYNLSTGTVKCACEDDNCTMTVSNL
jgi:hypothetical protein